jgi:hypothetical protein
VYGNWGTLQVAEPARSSGRGRTVAGPGAVVKAERAFTNQFKEANDGKTEVPIDAEEGPSLTDDWLDCMRSRKEPVYNALRGYQVMVAIKLGVDSYRSGKAIGFDPVSRRILRDPVAHREYPPVEA